MTDFGCCFQFTETLPAVFLYFYTATFMLNRINEAYSMIREGRYDLDPGEEWYREQYKETSRKDSILYHPLFRRVVLIGIAVSMFVVGIAAAFFSALRV